MQQPITRRLYRGHTGEWFRNKRAVTLRTLYSREGGVIKEGEIVTIHRNWNGFIVMSKQGVVAWYVPPNYLALLFE